MIQRIQSLFLALAALTFLGTGFFRSAIAVEESLAWLPMTLLGLNAVVSVGAIIAIFSFKNRKKQLQLTNLLQYLAILALVAAFGAMYLSGGINEITSNVGVMALIALPVLGYVFVRLANGRIKKDIELVRSMDRLR